MVKWKTFTEEELKVLRANPYVKSATANMIRFTVAFKEEFWRQHNEECRTPRQIIERLGFDPEILGQKRIDGILSHLRDQVNSGDDFRDVRKTPDNQITVNGKQLPPSKAILKMAHKIAYMEQELEFIKKTIKADNVARRKR